MADAGRVIAGRAGGLRLLAPGEGTRPLADRVKQSVFAALEAALEDPWERSFLDLFAGSGAAGIEALSRGAPGAAFVEHDAGAARVIAENLRRTRLEGGVVVRRDVRAWLAAGPPDPSPAGLVPFGAVFIDPPYAEVDLLSDVIGSLGEADRGWLRDDAAVIAKHFWKHPPPATAGRLVAVRDQRHGETGLRWYRVADAGTPRRST